MENEQEIIQKRLFQFLVNDVFFTITEDDVLSRDENGRIMHRGSPLTQGQIDVLKKEAKQLEKSHLFNILVNELRYHAQERQTKAQTVNDLIAVRMLAYFTDVLKSKVKKLSEL